MRKELLKNLRQRLHFPAPRRTAATHRRKNRGFRPALECLEGRALLAITLSSTSWTPIGPAPGGGFFSGRIDVAAADPGDANTIYVGATNGGIWKTTNFLSSTPSWTPLTDLPQVLSIAVREHDLVVFPGNPQIVLGAASGPGGGILRSDDSGTTWSFLANSRFDLAEISSLVVDPNVPNAQTLYAAVSGGTANFVGGPGVYKSLDGGATWSNAGSPLFSGFISDLLQIQESGQTVLYAADPGNGQPNAGGIYRSADGGANWQLTNLPANPNGYTSIRLAGSLLPTERIYASIIDTTGLDTRLSTSNMGGNWSQLNWPDAPGGAPTHRERHNLLAVDPNNSNVVYVNTDLETNATTLEFVWLSADGGQTWQQAGGAGDPVSGAFDGQGVFIACGDNGIYRRNPTTLNLDQKCGNLNTVPFYSFSLDPSNPRSAYGLMQDAPGTLKYTGNLQWTYTQPPNGQGEAGKIRVDPTNANRVYYLDPNTSDPAPGSEAARFVHCDDGGLNWQPAITGLPTFVDGNGNAITNYAFYGKNALVMDANNPQRLLLGLNSVFVTTTGGDPNMSDPLFGGNGWRDIGANMGNNGQAITAIALSPADPNTVWAGTYDGRVFKTTNAQLANPTWVEDDAGLPAQNLVMDLDVSPTDPNYAFAVTSTFMNRDDKAPQLGGTFHVWIHTGMGWTQINGNLPTKLGGEALAADWSTATPKLYLGTQRGVFSSDNLGVTWTLMDSLPRTRVTDLDFVPSLNLLGAGTFGRGAWLLLTKSTPPTVTPPGNQASDEGTLHSFDLGSFTDPDGGPWTVDVDWGDGTADTTFNAAAPGSLGSRNHNYHEEGPFTATITVTDTLDGQSDSETFMVDVNDLAVVAKNVSPISSVRGTCVGTENVVVATFTDPGGAEPNSFDPGTINNHYAATINWGDNSPTEAGSIVYTGTPGDASKLHPFTVSGSHIYANNSVYIVTVTISHEGTTPQVVQDTVTVVSVLNHAEGCCDSNSLVIGASTAGDTIRVVPVGKQTGALTDTVMVLINGVSQGTFTGFNRISIFGQNGNDDLQVDGAVTKDACIYGRGGDDRLRGGRGNNILVGGDGDDQIISDNSGGMSILIGGKGSDRLVGNGAGDVLIGDYTDFDDPCDPAHPDNEEMLCALHDAWTNSNAGYNARSAAVQAILAGHVHADGAADKLTGSSGRDLYYQSIDDKITGKLKDEKVVAVV